MLPVGPSLDDELPQEMASRAVKIRAAATNDDFMGADPKQVKIEIQGVSEWRTALKSFPSSNK